MSLYTIFNCCLIFAGAIVMAVGILRSQALIGALPLIVSRQQGNVARHLLFHRTLMVFFLCGYLVVLAAFLFQFSFITETFISLIFFFGAIFVYLGVVLQSRLCSEMQNTLQCILPVCAKCKKVRASDTDRRDPRAWKEFEEYFAEKTNAGLTPSYCPDCLAQEAANPPERDGKA